MTEMLYYGDAYLRECDASVIACDGSRFALDRTVFYPEGGGQPGDRGTFGSVRIIDTQKGDDGTVWHIAEGEAPSVGTQGHLSLDWEHRYHYMKEHSAQHLISALLHTHASIGTVAVHQGPGSLTIETDAGSIPEDVLLGIEDLANAAIRRGLRIWQDEVGHEEAESLHMRRSIKVEGRVKLVHIEDTDVVACGGIHASSTSELLEVSYVSQERIRGHVRTEWKCAEDAVAFRRSNKDIVSSLSALLSAEPGKVLEEAGRMRDEVADLKREAKKLERKAAEAVVAAEGDGPAVIFTELPASAFEKAAEREAPLLIADSSGRFLFHGSQEAFAELKARCPVRGGGRNGLYMGSYQGDPEGFITGAKEIISG